MTMPLWTFILGASLWWAMCFCGGVLFYRHARRVRRRRRPDPNHWSYWMDETT